VTEFVPAEGADVVDDLRAGVCARLPEREDGAKRIPDRGDSASVGEVERVAQDGAAELAHQERARVGVLDRDIRRPVRGRPRRPRLARLAVKDAYLAAVATQRHVRTEVTGRQVFALPAEQVRVEGVRIAWVGAGQPGPAEGARLVVRAFVDPTRSRRESGLGRAQHAGRRERRRSVTDASNGASTSAAPAITNTLALPATSATPRTIKLNPTIRQTAEAVKRSIMTPFETISAWRSILFMQVKYGKS
jgi:hypothetical protein